MPLINTFIFPIIATIILISLETWVMKRKNSPLFYVQFFCFVAAARLLFFISNVDAIEEMPKIPTFPTQKMWILTDREYNRYDNLYLDHIMWGKTYFDEADQMTVYIKKKKDRERAIQLFRQLVLSAVTIYDYKAFIGVLIVNLSEYGIEAYDGYTDMNTLLEKSKYNYEMAIFYLDILIRDGRGPSRG